MEKSLVLKCGIDEAGRGPLAGPVSAACVLLPSDFPLDCLNDSKKLTEKAREGRGDYKRDGLLGYKFC